MEPDNISLAQIKLFNEISLLAICWNYCNNNAKAQELEPFARKDARTDKMNQERLPIKFPVKFKKTEHLTNMKIRL